MSFLPLALCCSLLAVDETPTVPAKVQQAIHDLKHGNSSARSSAMRTLSRMGAIAETAVPTLIETLKNDPNSRLQAKAALALGQIGPSAKAAAPALIEALKTDSHALGIYALTSLVKIGPPAVPHLIAVIEDQDSRIRASAISALGRIGPPSQEAVPILIRLIEDEDIMVRVAAAVAVGGIGKTAKGAAPTLIKAINEKDSELRSAAVVALGRVGDDTHVPLLMDLLRKGRLRRSCIRALSSMGPSAATSLIEALENGEIELDAVKTLGWMNPRTEGVVPALIQALKNKDSNVRWYAVDALRRFGPRAKEA
ncbi:MAG: HEAT repeat domain-containing protein, partial [Planctomycetales bacterium]